MMPGMVLPNITPTSMALRLICGLWIVAAVLVAGFQQRSPWIIAPLALAYTVLFIAGKWDAWQLAIETGGWKTLPLGILTALPSQAFIVALFYGIGLGVSKLGREGVEIMAASDADWRFGGIVLGVGGALAVAANVIEARATASDDLFRQFAREHLDAEEAGGDGALPDKP